jgi:hypoxanthine phosphoribosyltransferase
MFSKRDKDLYLDNSSIRNYTLEIIKQMNQDNWTPDVVLGFARGGLIPAIFISHWYDIPMIAINKDKEFDNRLDYDNVLVIDDINDTGNTLAYFDEKVRPRFRNVKYAAVINNEASKFDINYFGYSYNKTEEPNWIVFPWETWWHDRL